MQVPNLLTPDQVIERLLAVVFGSSSAILVLYVLADFVWSWFTRIRLTVKYTGLGVKYGIDTARQARGPLFELGPVGAVLGFVISVVVLALQAIWLGLSYLIGNGLSWFLIGGRSGMRNGPDWKPFIAGLRWDWISGVYLAGAAVALLLVYQAAFDADWEEIASRAMTILTAPLMFVGGLSGADAEPEEVEALIEVDDLRLVLVEGQPAGCQPLREPRPDAGGLLLAVAEHDQESRRGESHPPPLAEPCGSLSAYTAPIAQPSGLRPNRQ